VKGSQGSQDTQKSEIRKVATESTVQQDVAAHDRLRGLIESSHHARSWTAGCSFGKTTPPLPHLMASLHLLANAALQCLQCCRPPCNPLSCILCGFTWASLHACWQPASRWLHTPGTPAAQNSSVTDAFLNLVHWLLLLSVGRWACAAASAHAGRFGSSTCSSSNGDKIHLVGGRHTLQRAPCSAAITVQSHKIADI
jgi:hypothetical protein